MNNINLNNKEIEQKLKVAKHYIRKHAKLLIIIAVLVLGIGFTVVAAGNRIRNKSEASGAGFSFELTGDLIVGNDYNGQKVLDILPTDDDAGAYLMIDQKDEKVTGVDVFIHFDADVIEVNETMGRVNSDFFEQVAVKSPVTYDEGDNGANVGTIEYLGLSKPDSIPSENNDVFSMGNIRFKFKEGVPEDSVARIWFDSDKSSYSAVSEVPTLGEFSSTDEFYMKLSSYDHNAPEKVKVDQGMYDIIFGGTSPMLQAGVPIEYTAAGLSPTNWQVNIKAVFTPNSNGPSESEVKNTPYVERNTMSMSITPSDDDVGKYLYFVVNLLMLADNTTGDDVYCTWKSQNGEFVNANETPVDLDGYVCQNQSHYIGTDGIFTVQEGILIIESGSSSTKPDLTPVNVAPYQNGLSIGNLSDTNADFAYLITNSGETSTNGTSFKLSFAAGTSQDFDENNATLTDGNKTSVDLNFDLTPGLSSAGTFSLSASDINTLLNGPDSVYLCMKIDSSNAIDELNETNNTGCTKLGDGVTPTENITLNPGQIVISPSIGAPAEVKPGKTVTYTANTTVPENWYVNIKPVFSTSSTNNDTLKADVSNTGKCNAFDTTSCTIDITSEHVGKHLHWIANLMHYPNSDFDVTNMVVCNWKSTGSFDVIGDSTVPSHWNCNNNSYVELDVLEVFPADPIQGPVIAVSAGEMDISGAAPGSTVRYTNSSINNLAPGWHPLIKPVLSASSSKLLSSEVSSSSRCNADDENYCDYKVPLTDSNGNSTSGMFLHFIVNLVNYGGGNDPHNALYCTWTTGEQSGGFTVPSGGVIPSEIGYDDTWVCANSSNANYGVPVFSSIVPDIN